MVLNKTDPVQLFLMTNRFFYYKFFFVHYSSDIILCPKEIKERTIETFLCNDLQSFGFNESREESFLAKNKTKEWINSPLSPSKSISCSIFSMLSFLMFCQILAFKCNTFCPPTMIFGLLFAVQAVSLFMQRTSNHNSFSECFSFNHKLNLKFLLAVTSFFPPRSDAHGTKTCAYIWLYNHMIWH